MGSQEKKKNNKKEYGGTFTLAHELINTQTAVSFSIQVFQCESSFHTAEMARLSLFGHF